MINDTKLPETAPYDKDANEVLINNTKLADTAPYDKDARLWFANSTILTFWLTNAKLADTFVHIPPGYSIKQTFLLLHVTIDLFHVPSGKFIVLAVIWSAYNNL